MFASIPEAIEEVRRGRMVVLVDDEDRENEGDLAIAAEFVTPEVINFMARHARGLICLSLTGEQCDRLHLSPMVGENTARFGTAFTVSVDARHGITTGISAADRAKTIQDAIREDARPDDLARPGHIFPLRAREGGTLVRAGQTEGVVDLARLAGRKPAGVICEIMNEDGTMARVPELERFCGEHGLKMCSVADIIKHRRRQERLVEHMVTTRLPTDFGEFQVHLYRSLVDEYLHIAVCKGAFGVDADGRRIVHETPVLVRVHSECLTGDIFHSLRCDCGHQLHDALRRIAAEGLGVLLYIRQEGRGIGLVNKLKAYALQDRGLDTVEANTELGLPADLRDYGTGAQILTDLGVRRMRLLTNNPRKIIALDGYGLEIVERVPLRAPVGKDNENYLRVKREKLGHLLADEPGAT